MKTCSYRIIKGIFIKLLFCSTLRERGKGWRGRGVGSGEERVEGWGRGRGREVPIQL